LSISEKYPPEFDDLDFEVIEEHWNEYELEDNSRVRCRIILMKIIGDPHNLQYNSFELSPVMLSVYAPLANRGERNNEPRPEECNNLPSYEVRIIRADEKYNRYKILRNGRIVKIKLEVPEINRLTNRFNSQGLPFYVISFGHSIITNDAKNKIQP
jgi:hypothetical protein